MTSPDFNIAVCLESEIWRSALALRLDSEPGVSAASYGSLHELWVSGAQHSVDIVVGAVSVREELEDRLGVKRVVTVLFEGDDAEGIEAYGEDPRRAFVHFEQLDDCAGFVAMLKMSAAGNMVFTPGVFVQHFMGIGLQKGFAWKKEISQAEANVLDLMAEGLNNRAIAARRFVTQRTVEHQILAAFEKMGLGGEKLEDGNKRVCAVLIWTAARKEGASISKGAVNGRS